MDDVEVIITHSQVKENGLIRLTNKFDTAKLVSLVEIEVRVDAGFEAN